MYTAEEKSLMNLSDIYTLMYGYIVKALMERYGEEGERAVREGTRQFGYDRGRTTRGRHLDAGLKINMENLFTMFFDLPADPRFRREKQALNPQERVSHTLVCPMADVWKAHGLQEIGRIYCEEFHPACYGEYAYGHTKVNLAKTLTQPEDEYCSFNVVLRPADLPAELRPVCFEEYDPGYVRPDIRAGRVCGKDGFHMLSIKLYYHLLDQAVKTLGPDACEVIGQGLQELGRTAGRLLTETAREYGLAVDDVLIRENVPISLDNENHAELWEGYSRHNAQLLWNENFVPALNQTLGKP